MHQKIILENNLHATTLIISQLSQTYDLRCEIARLMNITLNTKQFTSCITFHHNVSDFKQNDGISCKAYLCIKGHKVYNRIKRELMNCKSKINVIEIAYHITDMTNVKC